jgi:hypothetical protein
MKFNRRLESPASDPSLNWTTDNRLRRLSAAG